MPLIKISMRYAHSDGHTSLCFEETGRYMLTCGSDGDIRIWDGREDDDPVSKHVGEMTQSIVFKNNKFYVASEANAVFAYTFPSAASDGIVTRFSAPVTHMVVSKDGKELLAGSSDFSIKHVNLADHSFRVLLGHESAILSVDLDPEQQFAASSSCDGTVRIWNLEKQTCVKSWAAVFQSSNDFSASKVLCRITWEPVNGKFLAVPVDKKVKFYGRDKWNESFCLTDDSIHTSINVISFTACGRYLAAACLDGAIIIWKIDTRKCIERQKHEKGVSICSLEWNPNGKGELVFCDTQGQLGAFESPLDSEGSSNAVAAPVQADIDDFPLLSDDDDDDNENSFSISKIKAETVGFESFLDHDSLDGTFTAVKKNEEATKESNAFDEDLKSIRAISSGPQLSKLQEAFQPGSTPIHFPQRFMVWNSVGIVRSYNTDEENSIDVEFHDMAVHHAMHQENFLGHTMAAISTSALALACPSQLEIPSKLVCLHFGSWDSSKEWTIDLPERENIEAVAISEEWVAISTSLRHLRLFSIGSVQRHVLTLPGPVVAMAGHADKLVVCYHHALGIPGDQCLSMMMVNLANGKVRATNHSAPLSPKSTLAWLGFTDEGTPCSTDSEGIVRLLSKHVGDGWSQIANTKKHVKGKSDHSFIVGLSEIQQQIRCIPCKGSRYPATLPHPTVTVLPFELPLCEITCEKSQLEEKYWRQTLLLETLLELDENGFETDASHLKKSKAVQKESLMKLFALACRSDREFRALELSEMMDSSQTVQLAIRYASQLKRMQLAQKLGEVAYQKMEAESQEAEEVTVQRQPPQASNTTVIRNGVGQQERSQVRRAPVNNDEMVNLDEVVDSDSEDDLQNQDSFTEQQPVSSRPTFSNNERQNPFKMSADRNNSRGIHALDTMSKANAQHKTPGNAMNQDAKPEKTGQKPSTTISGKRQGQLFAKKKSAVKESVKETPQTANGQAPSPLRSGYQLWLEANREKIKLENPDAVDSKLALAAVQAFKKLPNDEKQMWNDRARNAKDDDAESTPPVKTKRKRDEDEKTDAENPDEDKTQHETAKAKLTKTVTPTNAKSVKSKLTGFAFKK